MSRALQNVDDVYPLTSTQEGMLYHTLSDPVSGVYVIQVITEISGDLETARFEWAWKKVTDTHEVLRTAFLWDGLDDPLQVVRSDVATEWHYLDLTGSSVAERNKQLTEFLDDDRRRGFNLANPPLSRMTVMLTGVSQWTWIWSFHHIIADGWSAGLMIDDLFATYGSTGVDAAGRHRRVRYRDFVAHHLARDEGREEAFWKERMAGFAEPHRLEVPGLLPSPDASGYKTQTFDLGGLASTAIATAARDLNVSVNTVFLGSWALVLSRWTRSTDVVFGTTVAGRPASLPGVESATGLFINTLPQRIELPPNMPVGAWLRGVQSGQIETLDYEQSSLAAIQRWSDVEGGQPLFDSIVVFENYPRTERSNRIAGIEIGDRTYVEQSNYPLAMLVIPGDSIRVSFVYDTAMFSDEAIDHLGTQVRSVLARIASQPLDGLAGLRLTTDDQDAWVAQVGAGTTVIDDGATIHEIIRQVAIANPDAEAVVDLDGSITYAALVSRAVTIADRLSAAGVGPNRLVGLYLHRSIDMIAGMLGILEVGGAYVPLDPAYPAAHLQTLLTDGGIDVVLTVSELAEGIPHDFDRILLDVDMDSAPADPGPRQPAGPTDLAYVIHTSGSTGRPKGVMVTHENLVHSTLARMAHYEDPVGSFLLLSSFSFDSSVAGIFWTLATGGTLVLPAPYLERDVAALLALASEKGVTHTLCLPSLYEVLLEHADAGQLDSLRTAIVAGEACPARILDMHRERIPGAELHNEYGPTEATVWCTVHRASDDDDILPIGRPIAGARIYLLDGHGNLVPPGFVGEICVAGSGVAPGYLGRPDLTAERFASTNVRGAEERLYRTGDLGAWRSDGVLLYLGRGDMQLKIRGHRIEAAAVETALRSYPTIREAVALGRSAPGRPATQLVAYVGTDGDDLRADDVKRHLAASLPEFMVPDLIVPLRDIPRLPNGKVDANALPDPLLHAQLADHGSSMKPLSPVEERLASIWSDALGVDVGLIGRESDFFALGGDSLLAIRVTSAIRREFEESLPLASLVRAPTLTTLAGYLEDRSDEHSVLVPMSGSGPETLYLIHPGGGNVLEYQPLSRHLPDSIRAVGVQAHGVDGLEDPDRSIGDMTERYAAAIEQFQPTGIINLAGHSTGGLLAFEVARTLQERGRTVGLLALLDATFPIGRTRGQRLARHWDTIREGGWRGVRTVAVWNWATVRINAGRIRHSRTWRKLQRAGEPLPPDLAGRRINHIALRLQSRHEPGEFKGKVTYIRAQDDACDRVQASPRLWRNVAEQVDVKDAPGRHTGPNSMMVEHNAKSVAWIIADELGSHVEQPELPTSSQSS